MHPFYLKAFLHLLNQKQHSEFYPLKDYHYSLKEFWYAPNAPISLKADKFGLEGFGSEWKHNTMNSQDASKIKLEIFEDIKNCVYLDSDSGLWYLTYLRDQNFDWNTIRNLQNIIIEMLKRDNNNQYSSKDDLFNKLGKYIPPVNNSTSIKVEARLHN